MVACRAHNPEVVGSSPSPATMLQKIIKFFSSFKKNYKVEKYPKAWKLLKDYKIEWSGSIHKKGSIFIQTEFDKVYKLATPTEAFSRSSGWWGLWRDIFYFRNDLGIEIDLVKEKKIHPHINKYILSLYPEIKK